MKTKEKPITTAPQTWPVSIGNEIVTGRISEHKNGFHRVEIDALVGKQIVRCFLEWSVAAVAHCVENKTPLQY